MIHVQNISLSFDHSPVLENLSFRAEDKDNICITGPSGIGKSTVLKILQGYLIPDSGTVKINNLELNPRNIQQIRSQMVYIPQNVNLPVNNGAELLKLMNASDKTHQMNQFLKQLDLDTSMLSREFDDMSGGQKQRIVIAACLTLDRQIILLDEPTSSLDGNAIRQLMEVLSNLEDKTLISSSHHEEWIRFTRKQVNLSRSLHKVHL